jgi:hypothetical protein
MERPRLELVPQRERPKNNSERLNRLIQDISERINKDLEKEYAIGGLLNPDGTISMESFAGTNGLYTSEQVSDDLESDYTSEVGFAVAHKLPFNSPEQKIEVEKWRESRNQNKATQIEMAIMALLYRMLKDEFIVIRSAAHDDYTGGVDNLIVNKKTGDVLCAIDDVHTDDSGIEGRDPNRGKAEKIKKIAAKGGAKVKYGVTVENGRLKKSKLENIPVFYLGLTSEQLKELMSTMSFDPDAAPTAIEIKLFTQMVSSLEEQKKSLSQLDLKSGIKNNLGKLDASLTRLNQITSLATDFKKAA